MVTRERFIASLLVATATISLTFPWPISADRLLGLSTLSVGGILPYGLVELMVKLSLIGAAVFVLIFEIRSPITVPLFSKETSSTVAGKLEFLKFTIYRAMMPLATRLERKMPNLGLEISKSNISMSPRAFLSTIIFATLIGTIFSLVGVYLLITSASLVPLALIPVGPMVFGIGLISPKVSQSSRGSATERELPFVISAMSVLASTGISPLITLRRLGKAEKLFPSMVKEAKRVLVDVDIFGHDPLSALEKIGRLNPNKSLADFFGGYVTVVKTGGDIGSFIDSKLRDIFATGTTRAKAMVDSIGTLSESYISATVIMGIALFVLMSMDAILQQTGSLESAVQNSMIFSALFVPAISIVFIYLTHALQGGEKPPSYKPFVAFGLSAPIIPIMIFLPIPMEFYTRLGIGLVASVIAPAIIGGRKNAERNGIEKKIPSFVLDLAEIRKTGLSPEKGIEQLSERHYGRLTKYIAEMSSQISWGVSLPKVMFNFSKRVNSFMAQSVAYLIVEAIEVGGGTVRMFTSLSDYTQKLSELERERKSALRPYVFIPYIGSIIVVASSVMMITLLTTPVEGAISQQIDGVEPAGLAGIGDVDIIKNTFYSGAIFQSFVMGFVAGKMGEGSLAGGFKHAGAMAGIASLTVVVLGVVFAGGIA